MTKNLLAISVLISLSLYTAAQNTPETCILDSTYRYNQNDELVEKEIFIYPAQEKIATTSTFDGSNWNFETRRTFSYDGNGNLTGFLEQTWTGSTWINAYKETSIYNGLNQITEHTQESSWNGSGWDWGVKAIYSFNSNDSLIERVNKEFDAGFWRNTEHYLYGYDGQSNLIEEVYQTWSPGFWENVSRKSYTFDAQANIIEFLNQNYYSPTQSWVNQTLHTYSFDGEGNETYRIGKSWNGSTWDNLNKNSHTYNGQDELTQTLKEIWDSNNGLWYIGDNSTKVTYTYLEQNLIDRKVEIWDAQLGSWDGLYGVREVYTYDSNDNIIEMINWSNGNGVDYDSGSRNVRQYDANENLIMYTYYTWDGTAWNQTFRFEHYYNCSPSAIQPNPSENKLNLWPNPTNGKVYIDFGFTAHDITVNAYNVLGELVQTETRNTAVLFDYVMPKSKGVYLIQLVYSHGKVTNLKVVKE